MSRRSNILYLHPSYDPEVNLTKLLKESIKMATKKKAVAAPVAKKKGRPAQTAVSDAKKGKPMMIFFPPKLHAQLKLAALATGNSISDVLRDLGKQWIIANKKKIQKMVSSGLGADEDDDEATEEEEVEEEDNDTEEEADEEESDEEEEEDEDEDED